MRTNSLSFGETITIMSAFQNKVYLESSFHAVDIDNPDLLPDVLLKPENFELAKEFVAKWNELKVS